MRFYHKYFIKYTLFAIVWILVFQLSDCNENINELYMKKLLKNVNSSADPCEDFYEYACGNWASNDDNTTEYVDVPGYMDHLVNNQLLDILQQHKDGGGIYEKLWKYYESCERLESPALNPYLYLVEPELNMHWPIFRYDLNATWLNDTNFDWLHTLAVLRTYGLNGVFLTQNINVRLTNGSHALLEIHQHQSRLQLKADDVAGIFEQFGMSKEESENVTMKIIELEDKMNNMTMVDFTVDLDDNDQKYISSFQEITMRELIQNVSNIDWYKYFTTMLGRDVNVDEELVQTFALNFEYFDELLNTLQSTSNETIAYYIMLKFMYHLNENLPNVKEKSMSCIRHLRGFMPLAMNYLYEEHLYKIKRRNSDEILMKMFNNLRLNFEKILDENYLELDEKEIQFILDELKEMQMKIGNVPSMINQTFVDNYYDNINVNATNFYANHLQAIKHLTRQQQKRLENRPRPLNETFFEHDPETTSSSSPVKIFDNAILVPYGYLQMPLFYHELNPLFQYSLMGFMLAHEIIHAYDLFHIVYDKHGNYNEMGLAIAKHFWKSVDCFAQKPSDSLSENVADVGGIRLVYQTYFDDVLNSIDEPLPYNPANYTSQQLFFMNSVQFLCANMNKISKMDDSNFNLEHDMHDVRVRRNWANFEQFSVAFQCPNGTAMNPELKCRLW